MTRLERAITALEEATGNSEERRPWNSTLVSAILFDLGLKCFHQTSYLISGTAMKSTMLTICETLN